jgi:hypothetical protein
MENEFERPVCPKCKTQNITRLNKAKYLEKKVRYKCLQCTCPGKAVTFTWNFVIGAVAIRKKKVRSLWHDLSAGNRETILHLLSSPYQPNAGHVGFRSKLKKQGLFSYIESIINIPNGALRQLILDVLDNSEGVSKIPEVQRLRANSDAWINIYRFHKQFLVDLNGQQMKILAVIFGRGRFFHGDAKLQSLRETSSRKDVNDELTEYEQLCMGRSTTIPGFFSEEEKIEANAARRTLLAIWARYIPSCALDSGLEDALIELLPRRKRKALYEARLARLSDKNGVPVKLLMIQRPFPDGNDLWGRLGEMWTSEYKRIGREKKRLKTERMAGA